jgi:PAS domain S-box-containing protein
VFDDSDVHADVPGEAPETGFAIMGEACTFLRSRMSGPLRTLIVAGRDSDAQLVVRELERAGFDPKWTRVETEEQFLNQLEASPDVIVADRTLSKFGAMRALEVLQKKGLDIPLIIVSGSVGEDIAVEAMRHGAADYLHKDRLDRLGRAVNNALEQSRSRKESKRCTAELRSTHEQLHRLLAQSPAVIYSLKIEDHHITPTVVSDNIERLLGVSVTESMRYEWWLESLHPDDRKRVLNKVSESLSGDGYSIEYRIRHKDGSYHWVEDNNRIVRDVLGVATESVGVWTDITERKEAEERLREQADIINRAHDAIIVLNFEDQRVVFWNDGAKNLYGWTADEAIGKSITGLNLTDPEQVESLAKTLLATGKYLGETRQVTKDGKELTVDSRATLVRNPDSSPRSVLIINTDITEQKKLETQLLRAQRLESIGTLASGVAHDLNNILLPILMTATILRRDIPEQERLKFLDILEASAERGAQIVRQVFTFARGTDGDHVLLQPVYLLEEIAKITQETFSKAVRVRTSYPEDLWLIEGDPTQLHQVLLNLCLNARDSMPEGGDLSLSAENFDVDEQYVSMTPGLKPGPHVLINVIDTGSGIPSHIIDKIFDPFFTTKELGKGTGLGLSTVLGIVKSHGGAVNVYGGARGTAFRVFLPAAPGARPPAELESQAEIPTGHGETILLIDDETAIREVAKAVLSQSGYKVFTAEDGPSALAIFAQQSERIALVLTDSEMPIMSGLVLARVLRKMDGKIAIVLSTARDGDYSEAELGTLGVQACLNKPYTRETLLRTIDRVLHNSS